MSLYSQFGTNKDKEVEGIEVKIFDAENADGTIPTFIICRMGGANKRYTKALEAAVRPYRRQLELGAMSNEKSESLFMEVFVDTILKGWQNVKAEDGSILEFTKQNAIALFKDLPDLYERLAEEARAAANFRMESLETEAKN